MPISPSKVAAARAARKWTQRELSVRSQIPQPSIARIESGRQCNAKVDLVQRLAEALGKRVDDLLD